MSSPPQSSGDREVRISSRRQNGQSGVIQPLLTDLYQITMAYAYWRADKIEDTAVFDLFFRKNPFHGEFTIFAGLEECLKFLDNFHYSESDIAYLKETLPTVDPAFFEFLGNLSAHDITVYAIDEGSVCFPRVPLMRVEGPLIVAQLLETTLLTLVNYASLVATNAARYRLAAGKNITLLEFGLRRAQGPDGGLSASKYAYLGGFDGTSNVLAGKLYHIPVRGTHAHAYISSFSDCEELKTRNLKDKVTEEEVDFIELCKQKRTELSPFLSLLKDESSDGELAAFASYAIAFPESFIALVDTYDTVRSGLLNFCAVALALNDLGYRPKGIRIDSGDLAYLSTLARATFERVAEKYDLDWFRSLTVVASNDINEETIWSLNEQGHQIDCFGIGTHLVTCQRQPALGCVYKLVEINSMPKIKLSEDVEKVTMPGRKDVYRLYGADEHALIDLLVQSGEQAPEPGSRVLCRHPFHESKRAWVKPAKVEPLYKIYWKDGKICQELPELVETRRRVYKSLETLRQDIKRNLNPTPFKVAVSDRLYHFIHNLWLENAPIGDNMLVEFNDEIIGGNLAEFLQWAQKIGGEVGEHGVLIKKAFEAQRQFLEVSSKFAKPNDQEFQKLLANTANAINEIQQFREKRRSSPFFNHLSAVSESIPALAWVTIAPTPAPYIKEMNDAGQFYTNRVLKDFKEKPGHAEWARAWVATLTALQTHVRKHHTTGLVWGKQPFAGSAPGGPGGPPPPPPPPAYELDMESLQVSDERAALFAELNKGTDVTRGLKKVTSEMQTHKNPNLRGGSTVPATAASANHSVGAVKAPTTKPPKFVMEGKKWLVEHQVGQKELKIDNVEMNQVVYLFACKDSTIQIKGKLNSIVVDSCIKTAIVFDSVVASIEFVNCRDCQTQVMGTVPTITIDKTDGVQMYLSKDSLKVEIVSAKSSALNVMVPQPNGDYTEWPVPEQFKTTIGPKGLITQATEMA